MNMKVWIEAFRLRTLPLAMSSIFMGGFLAYADAVFSWPIFILASITTLFLQILSNLANDYGDSISGVDNSNRVGPQRTVQSGLISRESMKLAVIIFIIFSLISGISLLFLAFENHFSFKGLLFFAFGCLAILAAIKYTVGKNPYGYSGFGDIMVFVFFGLLGVTGSYYLLTQSFSFQVVLPAVAVGLLSTAVLNLNNLRDVENDKASGKNTLVVKIGVTPAKIYHLFLLFLPFVLLLMYIFSTNTSLYGTLLLLLLPIQIGNFLRVWKNRDSRELDVELKRTAITTLFVVLIFGIGINI